jgi:hypothetical protein
MKKVIRSLLPLAVVAMPLFSMPASAEDAKVIDIASYLCKDIMRMSSDERSVALGLMHGYMLGKKGTTSFDDAKAGQLSTDFIEHCLDNPRDPALASFEKMAK